MQAVILAGGKGTRLAPYTKVLPKPLMPIGDAPILEIILLQLRQAGVHRVFLAVGHMAGLLRAFFQDGQRLGIHIEYCYEPKPLGTAGPIAGIPGLTGTFIVSNGDVLTTMNLGELLAFHQRHRAIATIAMHHRTVPVDYGVIECDGDHRITGYREKPDLDHMVSMGMYVFEPSILEYIQPNDYLDFPELVQVLISAGEKVVGFPFGGYWMDLGRKEDYERAVEDFPSISHLLPLEEADRDVASATG